MYFVSDLDGVMANTYESLYFKMKKFDDCHVPDFHTWETYLFETIVPEKSEWVREQFSDPLFFRGVAPFEEAYFWIKKMFAEGHKVDILTARYDSMKEITARWFKFNKIPYGNIYHVPREEKKYMIDVLLPDAVIEDDPRTAAEIASHGDKVYLINRSYNLNFDAKGVTRIDSLEEIEVE